MKIFFTILSMFMGIMAFGQYEGPVSPITVGYGSKGPYEVTATNISNDHFALRDISVFHPKGTITPLPTLLFAHGYGGNDTTFYLETMHNLASNGYAVVFVPYKSLNVTIEERYATLSDGYKKAARALTSIIDTSRVGFFGHSFGGGALASISYDLFTNNQWGQNGRFIYSAAPWYAYNINNTDLNNFPPDCKMLMVLYDNDSVNDHRLGIDIFNNIAIHDSIKECITVYSDTISNYIYEAGHSLSTQYTVNGVFNAYDYYVSFRLLNALADYTFTHNQEAKDIALGNGSSAQINMGSELKPLFSTDTPTPHYEQSLFDNPCDDIRNVRKDYCPTITHNVELINETSRLFPNPAQYFIEIHNHQNTKPSRINIINHLGQDILTLSNTNKINISQLAPGIYEVIIEFGKYTETKKLIILR